MITYALGYPEVPRWSSSDSSTVLCANQPATLKHMGKKARGETRRRWAMDARSVGVSPVPVQMWQGGRAQSRCICGPASQSRCRCAAAPTPLSTQSTPFEYSEYPFEYSEYPL